MENFLLYLSGFLLPTLGGFILFVGGLIFLHRLSESRSRPKVFEQIDKKKLHDVTFHEYLVQLAKQKRPEPRPETRKPDY